jgi:hypothetical protein
MSRNGAIVDDTASSSISESLAQGKELTSIRFLCLEDPNSFSSAQEGPDQIYVDSLAERF